jgi:DNA ligase-1
MVQHGDIMRYDEIVDVYIKIEGTTKRLEMTDHLVELIQKTPSDLLDKVLYLTQGKLYPDFMGIELGIADKLAIKAISVGTGIKENEVNSAMLEAGDLGSVAQQMVSNKKQQALFTEELDVSKVYDSYEKIARAAGSGSQDLKLKLVAELLHDSTPSEAKYIIRTLTGKLRLGIADMTILDAMAYVYTPEFEDRLNRSQEIYDQLTRNDKFMAFNQEKVEGGQNLERAISSCSDRTTASLYSSIKLTENYIKELRKMSKSQEHEVLTDSISSIEDIRDELKELKADVESSRIKIENAYNVNSDLGGVARVLITDGISGLDKITIQPGIPLRAMLAERLPSISEILKKLNGEAAFEYKYDGLRIQAHIDDDVQLFSRRLENITDQFPDVKNWLKESFKGKTAVVEGECVPVDLSTGELLPFQQVSHRRGRKYELTKAVDEYPVVLFLFDALFSDGEDLTQRPLLERREQLKSMFDESDNIRFSHILVTNMESMAEDFFEESLANGSEGLMAKSTQPDSIYRAGSRGWNWIKYKREYKAEMTDTVDLVVVGAFAGRGRRAGWYGALLMAAYNKDTDIFETVCKVGTGFTDEHLERIPTLIDSQKLDKKHARVRSEMKADYWFAPTLVLEIAGAEITHSPIHTCAYGVLRDNAGLAVRFPRFNDNWREDKNAEDATSSKEIVDMYRRQLKQIDK